MTSRSIYRHRLHCSTEDAFVYCWSEDTPTNCPHDINHIVDLNSISIIDTVSNNSVNIIQSSGDTGNNYRVEGKKLTIPPLSTLDFDFSWPYNISVLTVNWSSNECHRGDVVNGYVSSNTTVGALTENITSGDTIIHVSSTVLNHLNRGFLVTVTDNVHSMDMGECISIDKSAATIECQFPASVTMIAGSFIQMTINNIKNIPLWEPETVNLAVKNVGSSFLPAKTKVRLQYSNNANVEKVFCIRYEYFY